MERQAFRIPDSASPNNASLGFVMALQLPGIRRSACVFSPARLLSIMNLALCGIEAAYCRN